MAKTPFGLNHWELLLLAAVAGAWAGLWVWSASFPAPEREQGAVSWRQQERDARQEIWKTFESDPHTLRRKIKGDWSLWWRMELALFLLSCLSVAVIFEWGRFLLRLLFKEGGAPPLGSPPLPAWGGRQVLRLILLIALAIPCFGLAQAALWRFLHPAWLDRHVGALADTLAIDLLASAGVCWFFLKRRRGEARTWARPFESVRFSLRSYLFCAPFFVLLLMGIGAALKLFGWEPAPQPIFTLYLSEERKAVLRALLLLAVVAGPVAEELFFRGFLYRWLRWRVGVARGLLLSAAFFALLHADPVAFLPILGLGLLFGWVYERTGSLAAPIAVHILHNAGMLYAATLIKMLVTPG